MAFHSLVLKLGTAKSSLRISRSVKTGIANLSVAPDSFLTMENLQGFEGLSSLEESAVRLHEIYKSLMTGGFTEDEALSLIAKMTKPDSE